jgi:hypothetical protein
MTHEGRSLAAVVLLGVGFGVAACGGNDHTRNSGGTGGTTPDASETGGASGGGGTSGATGGTAGTSAGGTSTSTGGAGGTRTGTGGAGGTTSTQDASADDGGSTVRTCDGGAPITASPEGVWVGTQGGETFTVTFRDGCTIWKGTIAGTLCDYCAGTYSITVPDTATSTVYCKPVAACSGSSVHTDVGTLSLKGCGIDYAYSYGSGTNTWSGVRLSDAPGDACGLIDAGSN